MKKTEWLAVFFLTILLSAGCEKNESIQNTVTPEVTKSQEIVEVNTNITLSSEKSETAVTLKILDNVYLWDEHWKINENCNQDEIHYQSHFLNMPKIAKIQILKSKEPIKKPNKQEIEAQGFQRLSTGLFADDNMLMCEFPAEGVYACPLIRTGFVRVSKGTIAIFDSAFWNCDKITSICLTKTVKWVGNGAFGKMSSCEKIEVDEKNPYLKEKDGVLYMRDGKVLIAYPAGKKENIFTIPKGVKYIADGAFAGAKNLEQVVLSDSVEYIGYQAFDECTNLKIVKNAGKEQYKFVAPTAFTKCETLQERIRKNYNDETYIKNWHALYKFLDDIENYWDK